MTIGIIVKYEIEDFTQRLLASLGHHLGINPQANRESPLKWTKESDLSRLASTLVAGG